MNEPNIPVKMRVRSSLTLEGGFPTFNPVEVKFSAPPSQQYILGTDVRGGKSLDEIEDPALSNAKLAAGFSSNSLSRSSVDFEINCMSSHS